MRVRRVVLSLFFCSLLSATAALAQAWDVGVMKGGPDTTTADADVTYAVTIFNAGPDDATVVTLMDGVPAGMTFVSATQLSGPAFTCDATITCTIATLPAGASADFNFTFHTDPAAPAGTFYLNIATVSSAGGDVNSENDTAVYGTFIPAPSADLGITKSGPSATGPDTDITYTIIAQNNGTDDAATVTLSDTLPGDQTFVSLSQSGSSYSCATPAVGAGGTITCTSASLPAGDFTTFTLTTHVPVTSPSGTTYVNTATLSSASTLDPNPDNDSSSAATSVSSADLSIVKTGPTPVTAGQTVDYTITLSNGGPDTATDAAFTDFAPAGTTVVSVLQNSGPAFSCSAIPAYAFCSAAFLANGASATFTVTVSIASSVTDQSTLTNTATTSSGSFDPNPANDSSSTSATVTGVTDLVVTKTGPSNVTAGTNISWDLTVANIADGQAFNVALTDSLPAGMSFVSLTQSSGPTFNCTTGATINCTIASLDPLASSSFTIVAAVASNMIGAISNTATVSSTTSDLNPANDSATATTTIDTSADLSVTKSGPATTLQDQDVTYTISLANAGPSDAQNFVLSDSTPASTTFVSISAPAGFTCTTPAAGGTGAISCTNPTLANAAGGTITLVLHTDATAVGSIDNTATVSSLTPDPNAANNSSTATVTALPADLSITKSGTATAPAGGTIQWTITVTNSGPADATSLALNDALPAEVTFLSLTSPAGFVCTTPAVGANGTVNCTATTLANGATATFTLDATIAGATAPGTTIMNTATIASPIDTAAGNNSASANTLVAAPPAISKSFAPASIPLNSNSTLTFTISNPNAVALSGVGFSDNFPAGVIVATPDGLGGTCGGTTIATSGSSNITLTNAAIPAGGSCTVTVDVTGTTAGVKNNTTGAVTSNEGGTGGTASATLTVVDAPSIAKAFGASSIPLGGTTSLTFTLTNPNATTALTSVAFDDALPAQLLVATPSALTSTCGGSVTANDGGNSVSLTGGSIAAGGNCTITVNVLGAAPGLANNITSLISSAEGSSGGGAIASITVVAPPSISKAFGAASIPVNGSTSLTFTLTNPNTTTALTGIAFDDALPAQLLVATPNALTSTCGGASTAVDGSGTVSLAGGTLAAGGSCTMTLNVTGVSAGIANNATTAITSAEGGTGTNATATITVVAPPTIAKAFGAASIPLGGTTSLTFTLTNTNPTTALTGVAFGDALPAQLVVATPSALTSTCGGTTTANSGSGSFSLTGGTIVAGSSCTIAINVTGVAQGVANNITSLISSAEGGSGIGATASITVVAPPTIAKAFGAASIPLNGSTSLTFTITNPNLTAALSGVAFTDTLPANLVVATPNGLAGACGGAVVANAGSNSVTLTGGTIAAGGNCTILVNVTGTAAGTANNTTGAVTSIEGGAGNTANASVTVIGPQTITKSFDVATIPTGGTATLTFTIFNGNAASGLTGVSFTDPLPANLVVSTPNALTSTCGGAVTATAGSGTVSLTGGTIAASSSCTISVGVTGIAGGVANNTTGPVSSIEAGAGNTASATITVVDQPAIAKAFGAASIPVNAATSLTFTISNPNATMALSGVSFTDSLPANLVVSNPNGLANTCGGTPAATAGGSTISLTGGTVAAGGTCTMSVNVTGTTAGVANNTTGAVTSTESGAGNTASAAITVVAPPSIAKAFGTASIPLNGSTSLSFTITNPNLTTALSGVAFTDTLPANLVVATPNGLAGACGGTVVATAGSNSVTLTGGNIAAGGNCTISINVTGTAAGAANNTTGAVTSTEGGTGNTASASLTVVGPQTITKSFDAATIRTGGTATLTFTILNGNLTSGLTGVSFTDPLPVNLVVSTPNALTSTCGGTVTATAGSGAVSLTGGTIAASGSCTISVGVAGIAGGVANNTTGPVSSIEAGASNTASATITVVDPPVIAKAFGAASIPVNAATSLTFTISNPNATMALGGISFTDSLPANLVIANPNGLASTCGGTPAATAGGSTISLTGGTVAAGGTCTMSVSVTGTTAGVANNTTSAVTSAEGGAGNTASATIMVVAPPSIAKAFGAATIPLNGSTSLTFTIANANLTTALSGIAFTDTLPANLVVATPNGLAGACGGAVVATAGSNIISLTGGTIAAAGTCTIAVNVTGISSGIATNTTGVVTSTEGGAGNTAAASLTVAGAPTIAKAFGASAVPLNGSTSLTFTLVNPNVTPITGVGFTDALPGGLIVSTPNALVSTCGGTVTAAAGSGSVTLSGATVGAGSTCTIRVNVTGTAAGALTNTTGPITSLESGAGNTATATLTVVGPPSIAKAFAVPSIHINTPTQLTFTITNPNATVALTGVAFTDTLPANLVVANPNGMTSSCGGTVTAAAGSNSVALTGGTVAAAGTCAIALNIAGIAPGPANNTTSVIASANGGAGNAATATIIVVAGPVLKQTFGSNSIPLGGSTTLTFTLFNPNPGTTLTGISFTNTLPTNLLIATPNGLTGGCGGATIVADAGTSTIMFTGGTLAPGASCSFTINVTGTVAGIANNSITPTSSAGSGGTSIGTIVVLTPDLVISKTHAGPLTPGTSGVIYTITVANHGAGPTLGMVTVIDTLPAGLIARAFDGSGWTCTLASLTCTRSDVLAAGASYPAISLVVEVAVGAPLTISNRASVSGGGELDATNSTAVDAATLTAAIPTLSPLSMLLLGFALAFAAMSLMRRMS